LRAAGAQSVSEHPSIEAAHAHARAVAATDARIIVFGSFTTVAAAMQVERQVRAAGHGGAGA
ncbi:MAG TPA: hypothetical protein DEH78_20355, partial [Solibacterales bacterium]|nr:hypothetical protein [Bryobacterales bacterium]